MTHLEDDNLLAILIVGAVVHGVAGLLGLFGWLYMWWQMPKIRPDDDQPKVCAKITWRHQRQIVGATGVANMMLSLVLIGMILKIGTLQRGTADYTVNWTYFAIGESVAFCMLGVCAAIYYWFSSTLNMILLAGAWALWCVILGVAALSDHFNARLYLWLVALAIQLCSVVFWFVSANTWAGMFRVFRGYFPALIVAMCLIVYDVFWYIGYNNRLQPGVHIHQRWLGHLAFLCASVVCHILVPAGWAYFHEPKAADVAYEMTNVQTLNVEAQMEGDEEQLVDDGAY